MRARYERQLAERAFQPDLVQQRIVERLDGLRDRLIDESHAGASTVRRILGVLGGRAAREPQRGLYLWGGVGRGKTWLMDLFYQSLPFAERRRRHFHLFMREVHGELAAIDERESPLEIVAEHIAAEVRVLCLDELFVSDIADAMILGGLFAGLFDRGVTLVCTSNQPPGELYKGGLQRQRFMRTIELLEAHLDIVEVDGGTDYRLRRLAQAGTYLAATAADTPQRLASLFEELADPAEAAVAAEAAVPAAAEIAPQTSSAAARATPAAPSSGSIRIEDRAIPIVRASERVVWFDFQALCVGPRSQNDYIEIARRFRSVILSGVPVLDSLYENAARRFIALVDELYDHNVQLIVAAAAPPADLYRGEKVAFDFQRTTSRLIEMGSLEYLARAHRP